MANLKPVTDQALIDQLNTAPELRPVTDEKILFELNASPKEPSIGERALRTAGLGARAIVQGAAAIPTMMAEGVAYPLRALTGGRYFPSPSATLNQNLTNIGLPEPQNATERVTQDVVGGMAGGGATMAAGRVLSNATGPVVSKIGELLTQQPILQTVGAATGAASGGVARENGAGPIGQTIASLVGGVAPSLVRSAAPAAAKGVFRGGEEGRQTTANNIKLFEDSGYGTPTAGQATESRFSRGIESGLSKTPGGAGRMVETAERGSGNLSSTIEGIADDISPRSNSTKAGAAIEKGVRSFVDRFKGEQNFLYDKIDTYIPKDTLVKVDKTKAALSQLNADIPGAPAISELFKNAKIQGIEGALKSDIKSNSPMRMFAQEVDGGLPYEALKKLRTLVGNELDNPSLVSDVPRSKWKALYAALSDDLGDAAKAAGPDAEKAFTRANSFTRAGHERIGTYLDRVSGKDTTEKIFNAAVNPSEIREGASTINAVMKSLDQDSRKVVQAAFLKRMGLANASAQDAAGEVFSTETFLTNWNKISPEAKMTLFAGGDGKLRDSLDKIAKVASNVREGSKVFANPSGTQQAISNQFASGGFLLSLLTGNVPMAAAIGGTVASANVTSRLMTNPDFVKWLATTTTKPIGAIPASLNALAQSAQKFSAEDRAAVDKFITESNTAIEQQQKR